MCLAFVEIMYIRPWIVVSQVYFALNITIHRTVKKPRFLTSVDFQYTAMSLIRKMTHQRNTLFLGLLAVGASISPSAFGSQWFVSCESVARQFPKTRPVLTQGEECSNDVCKEHWRRGLCFILNRRELIYEDVETGTNFQGLYYLDLDKPDVEPERLTTSVESIREFTSPSGLRFAVIKSHSLRHGHLNIGMSVLWRSASSSKSFQVADLFETYDNAGCATPEAEEFGCGMLEYGLVLRDSSGREFKVKSGKPLVYPSHSSTEQGYLSVRKGAETLNFPLESGDYFVILRYRLQKNPSGFYLENWIEVSNVLKKYSNSMANPSINTDTVQ